MTDQRAARFEYGLDLLDSSIFLFLTIERKIKNSTQQCHKHHERLKTNNKSKLDI